MSSTESKSGLHATPNGGHESDFERALDSLYEELGTFQTKPECARFLKLKNGLVRRRRVIRRNLLWKVVQVTFDNRARAILKQPDPKDKVKEVNERRLRAELAAYLVSEILGFRFVPTTILRDVDGQISMVQRYISRFQARSTILPKRAFISQKTLNSMKLFDFMIQNPDRHGKNYLVGPKRLYAIDNEDSFLSGAGSGKLHTAIDKRLATRLRAYAVDTRMQEILRKALRMLIPSYEAEAFSKRILAIAQSVLEDGTVNAVL